LVSGAAGRLILLRFAESNFPRYAALDGIMPIAGRGGIQLAGLGGGKKGSGEHG
jgi:hypothetical protein